MSIPMESPWMNVHTNCGKCRRTRRRSHSQFCLSQNIHPADLARVRSAFATTRAVIGAHEIDSVFYPVTISSEFPLVAKAKMRTSSSATCLASSWMLPTARLKKLTNCWSGEELWQLPLRLLNLPCSLRRQRNMAHELTSRLMALGRA
jgi:hypothetical protein